MKDSWLISYFTKEELYYSTEKFEVFKVPRFNEVIASVGLIADENV